MRKLLLTACLGIMLMASCLVSGASAGNYPVNDVDLIRKMLLQPDADFSLFIGGELCDAFMYLIDTDDNERVVHRAVARLWQTGDERSVPYLIEYMDKYPMDCLYGLGSFSTPDSCYALLAHLNDDDEFNRRFSAQSLGKLDYTVTDEMWSLRDTVLAKLGERFEKEKEEWILPILSDAYMAVSVQVLPEEDTGLSN